MKDFDQFFRDRLDGERPFSRRDENWRQLSRRLEAFDSGIQDARPVSNIRRWTTLAWKVAACAAAAATIWVGVQNYSLRRQNVLLNELLTQIKAQQTNEPATPATQISPLEIAAIPDMQTHLLSSQNDMPLQGMESSVASSKSDSRSVPSENVSLYKPAPISPFAAGNALPVQPTITLPAQIDENVGKQAMVESARPATPAPQEGEMSEVSFVWEKLPIPDSILSRPITTTLAYGKASVPVLPELSIEAAKENPPPARLLTKPVKDVSRVRVGIQAVAGTATPAESGVSWHKGQSLTAEIRVWNQIWLGASADFVQFEIDADNNPDRFHLPEQMNPDPPGGPVSHHQYDLVRLQSEQRQRRFAAGVRYTLPVRGRITPSVQVGYVWAQMPASFVQYEFKKKPHGGGHPNPDPFDNKFFIRKTENHWEQNICRFGAGADYALGRWSLGLTAQYDKNFTNKDPLFDMLSFKLGASYQF
ncbi:MAG: hypothetical protein JNL02_03400 [Saprospiraceae bacterium]|nr:hypothetical protein [Saprospiraceae bacterium]